MWMTWQRSRAPVAAAPAGGVFPLIARRHQSHMCVGLSRTKSRHCGVPSGNGSSHIAACRLSSRACFSPALYMARRSAGVDLLSPLAKLGQSRDLAADIKAGRQRSNKDIIASFEKIQANDEIHYRKTNRPWTLVPKYAKKRVSDLCGVLTTEDRMEIEQIIEKMQSFCDVDMYVVIVPTVGYTTPRAFSNSIMFDWDIGNPKGNGLLLLIAQREATVHLVASPAIEEYFSVQFLDPSVREIFQPLVREGRASYATVQLVYAIARQAQEMRPLWERGFLALPTRNRVRFTSKTVHYGFSQVPYLVIGVVFFGFCTVVLGNQLLDTICPDCHGLMNRIRDDATMKAVMEPGQYLEFVNSCAYYRVWKCPKCADSTRVVLVSRDLHQSTHCLKCMDCNYYTSTLTKEVVQLPSKDEDGIKQLLYKCDNCHVGREVLLPLYRPIEENPDAQWYDFLIERSNTHKDTSIKL